MRMSFWMVPESLPRAARPVPRRRRCRAPGSAAPRRSWSSRRSSCRAGCRRTGCACRGWSRWRRPPCRRRPSPAGGRSRSRGGWRGRRRSTGPSARPPGCGDRRRWSPRPWRSPRTGGWSTGWSGTWSDRARAGTARGPDSRPAKSRPGGVGGPVGGLDRDALRASARARRSAAAAAAAASKGRAGEVGEAGSFERLRDPHGSERRAGAVGAGQARRRRRRRRWARGDLDLDGRVLGRREGGDADDLAARPAARPLAASTPPGDRGRRPGPRRSRRRPRWPGTRPRRRARSGRSGPRRSRTPAAGSATRPMWASSISTSWVLRLWRRANSVGRPSASVKAPSTTVSAPPTAAPKPAAVRRIMLVQASLAVSMRPRGAGLDAGGRVGAAGGGDPRPDGARGAQLGDGQRSSRRRR